MNEGTIRIEYHAGMELTSGTKRIGFDACLVDNPKEEKSGDLLVGDDLPDELGRLVIQTERNKKPLVMVQAINETRGKMKTLDGKDA